MRTFIVAQESYGDGVLAVEEADIKIVEAETIRDLLYETVIDTDVLEKKDMWKAFDNANGNGQPFFFIKELIMEDGKPKLKDIERGKEK